MFDFTAFLNQKSLIRQTVPDPNKIVSNVTNRAREKTLNIMYGETYDRFGFTLGSLKYYFAVALTGKLLHALGANVSPTILIADIATCRNEPEEHHELLMEIGRQRASVIGSLNDLYGLELDVLLMSEYLHTKEFQTKVAEIRELAKEDNKFHEWIVKTVPESKIDIESKKDFAYAFDEVATITSYDIKIGPPRELFYDEPARMVASAIGMDPLLSIYLYPTYPLGLGRSFFLNNEEIEEYGVTPYKAGSKGLEANRIILGLTGNAKVQDLISQSAVSKNHKIPNAVLDIAIIAEMAKQFLAQKFEPIMIREEFYEGGMTPDQLRELAFESLLKNIMTVMPPISLKGMHHVE